VAGIESGAAGGDDDAFWGGGVAERLWKGDGDCERIFNDIWLLHYFFEHEMFVALFLGLFYIPVDDFDA